MRTMQKSMTTRCRTLLTCLSLAVLGAPGQAAGNLYSSGHNDYGQLGNGGTGGISPGGMPGATVRGAIPSSETITAISAGQSFSLALTSAGRIYGWGSNDSGQLGNGSTQNSAVPVAVNTSGILAGKTITAIAAAGHNSLALSSDGHVYSWGSNAFGLLGNGNTNSTQQSTVPVAVETGGALLGKTIIAIAAGAYHHLVLTSDGRVYGWGFGGYGQLGQGNMSSLEQSAVPVAVDTSGVLAGKTITAIAVGDHHSLALSSDGHVYCWGRNSSGQLGTGSTDTPAQTATPIAVDTSGVLAGKTIAAIAAGSFHNLVLTSDGRIYGWGDNNRGELGIDTYSNDHGGYDFPAPVAIHMDRALAGKTITSIAAGGPHSFAISSDSYLYGWGGNYYGELGIGPGELGAYDDSTLPAAIGTHGLLADKTIAAVAAGEGHTLILAANVPLRPQLWQARDLAVGSDNLSRLLWARPDNAFALWTLSASNAVISTPLYGPILDWNATAIAVGSDSKARVLLNKADGQAVAWTIQNPSTGSITSTPAYGPISGFTCTGIATAGNNTTRLLWTRLQDGAFAVWTVDASGNFSSTPLFGPITGWRALAISVGGDNKTTLLLRNFIDERAAVWTIQNTSTGAISSTPTIGPFPNIGPIDIATGSDNKTRVLFVSNAEALSVWTLDTAGNYTSTPLYGPISGWTARHIAVGGDLKTRVLLNHTDGRAVVWTLDNAGNIASTPAFGPIVTTASASPTHGADIAQGPSLTLEIPDQTSPIVLSAASASATDDTVTLSFTGPLDPATATDVTRYTLTANALPAIAKTAAISGGNTITLKLEDGTLHTGDTVKIDYRLLDAKGLTVAGTATVTAR